MTESPHMDLSDAGVLMPLLKRHEFFTRKGLGQHFLISRKALVAIIDACELADDLPVLEIGPGIGTVTRALAEQGARVTAVELDTRAIAVLQETVGDFPHVQIVQGDIMKIDLAALMGNACWTVVGNLPYYITTPVISRILEMGNRVRRAVFMVQREVADRLQATPGSKFHGSLSVYAQTYAEIERVIRVPKGAFLPPPTVESAVIRLRIRPEPLVPASLSVPYFQVTRAAFGQRRKTLENALAGGGILGGNRSDIAEALASAGIDGKRRGETLSIAEFLSITEEVARRQ